MLNWRSMLLLFKQKKDQTRRGGGKRILINITVLGSAGPIRFVVNEEEPVAVVIETALKSYARDGRLPVLGTKLNDFFLYCPIAGTEAMSPWEMIGSFGVRNFMLCKKARQLKEVGHEKPVAAVEIKRKSSGSWKSWFNKSLTLKVTSH